MTKLLDFVGKKNHLIVLFALVILFNVLLSFFMPKDQALDLKFAYTFGEAYQSIETMDLETRQIYRLGVWTLDFPYMILYSLAFYGLLFKIWGNRGFIKLPFLIALMDLGENLLVIKILNSFPDVNKSMAILASVFTTSKWILVGVLMLFILGGLFKILHSKALSKEEREEVKA